MMGNSSVASVLGTLSGRRIVLAESSCKRGYLDRALVVPILGCDPALALLETHP